MSQYLIIYHY